MLENVGDLKSQKHVASRVFRVQKLPKSFKLKLMDLVWHVSRKSVFNPIIVRFKAILMLRLWFKSPERYINLCDQYDDILDEIFDECDRNFHIYFNNNVMKPQIPNETKSLVIQRWLQGVSRDTIAANNGLSAGAVTNIVNEWR
jgi:hypothetical protein